MKRRVIQVVVFLLLGAIFNVGLTIACVVIARSARFKPPSSAKLTVFDQHWLQGAFESRAQLPAPLEVQQCVERFGVEVREIVHVMPAMPEFRGASVYRHVAIYTCAGWPNESFVGGRIYADEAGQIVFDALRVDSMASLAAGNAGREFPLRPLWIGFLINTIFYAAILWPLMLAPGAVRRTIRRRRGLCPACAYPIGTSPVCTECGKPVTPRRIESPP